MFNNENIEHLEGELLLALREFDNRVSSLGEHRDIGHVEQQLSIVNDALAKVMDWRVEHDTQTNVTAVYRTIEQVERKLRNWRLQLRHARGLVTDEAKTLSAVSYYFGEFSKTLRELLGLGDE